MISVEKVLARHQKRRQQCHDWYWKNRAKRLASMAAYRCRKKAEREAIPRFDLSDPHQRLELEAILKVRPDFEWRS